MKKNEVIKLIGRARWKDFEKWMRGQTVGIDIYGNVDYYEHDVQRFIDRKPVVD